MQDLKMTNHAQKARKKRCLIFALSRTVRRTARLYNKNEIICCCCCCCSLAVSTVDLWCLHSGW